MVKTMYADTHIAATVPHFGAEMERRCNKTVEFRLDVLALVSRFGECDHALTYLRTQCGFSEELSGEANREKEYDCLVEEDGHAYEALLALERVYSFISSLVYSEGLLCKLSLPPSCSRSELRKRLINTEAIRDPRTLLREHVTFELNGSRVYTSYQDCAKAFTYLRSIHGYRETLRIAHNICWCSQYKSLLPIHEDAYHVFISLGEVYSYLEWMLSFIIST